MSREYDLYLEEHKANVAKGYRWIRENLPEIIGLYYGNEYDLEQQICYQHDVSKTEMDEYIAYDRYFYGGPSGRSYGAVKEFNYAWLRHQNRNGHHWQFWNLIQDDPNEGIIALDIPFNYLLEMVMDWWSFSWSKGDLTEIFNWYDKHKDYMKLSPDTRNTVEMILEKIKSKLDEIGSVMED